MKRALFYATLAGWALHLAAMAAVEGKLMLAAAVSLVGVANLILASLVARA